MTDLIKMLFSDPLPPQKSTGFQGIKCGALPRYLFASVSSCIQRSLQNNSNNNNNNNETSQKTYYLVSFVVSSIVCVLL